MERSTPIYVKIDEYQKALDTIEVIKNKIQEAKMTLNRIEKLRYEENTEIDMWNSELREVEGKLRYIDELMFKPEP
jgi:hypothetical protein